ncbi:MAG: bacteriohopanetetrol glucosamine biosynthesis glycosyltransferase HpnI [Armatimonadota bacterium]
MSAISLALLALAVLGTLYYVLSTVALVMHMRTVAPSPRPSPPGEGDTLPLLRVSILKPVHGVDADAQANFLTFLNQDYPSYEVLFGVLDFDDPAVGLIREVIECAPRASLHIGSNIRGFNNKVRILHTLARHASGEILIITDADTRATPDFLRRIISPFEDSQVGMVTCMYRGANGKGIVDALEGLHMTCIFAPGVAAANALNGIDFGLGAAIAIRRKTLELIGGFESIADHLADDFQLGRKSARIGHDVKLSDYVIDIALSRESLANVLGRELRWSVTTRVSRPSGHFGLIVTYGFAYALLFAASTMFSTIGWCVLGAVAAIRWLTAYIGARICLGDRDFPRRAWLLPIRDLLSFAIWIAGYFQRTVSWHGRRLELRRDGRIVGAKG